MGSVYLQSRFPLWMSWIRVSSGLSRVNNQTKRTRKAIKNNGGNTGKNSTTRDHLWRSARMLLCPFCLAFDMLTANTRQQPRLDRIFNALSSFRGSRRWPFERKRKPGPKYFWDQVCQLVPTEFRAFFNLPLAIYSFAFLLVQVDTPLSGTVPTRKNQLLPLGRPRLNTLTTKLAYHLDNSRVSVCIYRQSQRGSVFQAPCDPHMHILTRPPLALIATKPSEPS